MRKAAAFGYILTQKNLTVCQECGKGTFSQIWSHMQYINIQLLLENTNAYNFKE